MRSSCVARRVCRPQTTFESAFCRFIHPSVLPYLATVQTSKRDMTNKETKKLRIAIVDDSLVVRERLAQILNQRAGIEIAWQAGDVPEAEAAFESCATDAVVLDIHLPNGSGIDLLKRIKFRAPATKVIMLTNYPVEILRHRCHELGADAFFDKSAEFHRVFEMLQMMVNS